MNYLRRRVRGAFLIGALSLLGGVVLVVTRPAPPNISELSLSIVLAGCIILGALYGMAWYTTRKPSPYRNNWAVVASFLSLLWGLVLGYAGTRFGHGGLAWRCPGLLTTLTGIGGLYLYALGGAPPKPESDTQTVAAAPKRSAFTPPPPSGRKPSSAPTAIAPSLLAASSPELAAAAASPGDPNGSWDPLMALRTQDTMRKLRS